VLRVEFAIEALQTLDKHPFGYNLVMHEEAIQSQTWDSQTPSL